MNLIDSVIIHCSATKEGLNYKKSDIESWHKERGFKQIGYHFVIDLDGTIEEGRPLTMNGAHCNEIDPISGKSYNSHSIGICYVGGLDKKGKPKDTRTEEQKESLSSLIYQLVNEYPITDVFGHRDASPDLNKDGKVSPNEWVKDCPCFDVRSEYPLAICVAQKIK